MGGPEAGEVAHGVPSHGAQLGWDSVRLEAGVVICLGSQETDDSYLKGLGEPGVLKAVAGPLHTSPLLLVHNAACTAKE